MNLKKLNGDLLDLIELRNEINTLTFNDDRYDELEDELIDFEDTFNEKYGEFLEDILQKIHEELFTDVDVQVPTAYVAKKYTPSVVEEDQFEIDPKEGLILETNEIDEKERIIPARLAMYPNPTRYIVIQKNDIKTVWSADKPSEFNF